MKASSAIASVVALLLLPVRSPAADLDCTDQMVAQLVRAGVARDLILQKIAECDPHFQLDPASLISLKEAGVPDDFVRVMARRQSGQADFATTRPVEPDAADGAGVPDEVGIYWVTSTGELVRLEGMAVSNERTGSLLASMLTLNIKRARINAQLKGARARLRVKDRDPEFYFYLPEGASIGDYVLLSFAQRDDVRQIEVAERTLWKAQSGVDHDKEIDFDYKRIRSRLYSVIPRSELQPGEYGFYIASGVPLTKAAGRIYDFGID